RRWSWPGIRAPRGPAPSAVIRGRNSDGCPGRHGARRRAKTSEWGPQLASLVDKCLTVGKDGSILGHRCLIFDTRWFTMESSKRDVRVTPVAGSLGAQVDGLQLRDLSDEGFAVLHQALLDHQVVFVRGQHLSE